VRHDEDIVVYEPTLNIDTRPTGIAVLGCGYWGINHVRVFGEMSDAHVAVVCDARPARLDDVARRFPDVKLTTSIDEALSLPAVDAAVVCTPAATHREVTALALAAGKHVLVEKPFTTDVAEATELIALAASHDRVLLAGHTFIYNPGVEYVKQLLEEGRLGDVYCIYARRTNLGPFRWDVNALWDLAPHDVAIFNYLLGSVPTSVSAVGARVLRSGREDVGFVSLRYPGGVIAHIHVSWADPHKVREFVVVGSEARAAFNDLDVAERVRVYDRGVKPGAEEPTSFGEYHFQVREGNITSPALPVTEPLKALAGHFIHCIRRGLRPRTDGEHGRDVVAVMQAIELSLEKDGAPVALDEVWERYEGTDLARAAG
jgi:predicted dehydrogenase